MTVTSMHHPTNRPNFALVHLPHVQVYYSYETPIAFYHFSTGMVIRRNDWGPTTGKHLHWVKGASASASGFTEVTGEHFERKLATVLTAGEYVIEESEELTLA